MEENSKEEKKIDSPLAQKAVVYKSFDNYWKTFKRYNILSRFNMFLRERGMRRVLATLEKGTALDIGCGVGRTMTEFKKCGFDIVGVDNSPASISICKKKGFKVFLTDAESMEFPDASFDIVFAEGLLEHFNDWHSLVGEMTRLSKKHILLIQPNSYSMSGKMLDFLTNTLTKGNVREIPYRVEEYKNFFKKYGCELILQKNVSFNTFIILLFKKI